MTRTMLHGKIHRATVTGADIAYVGSVTVDPELLEAADLLEYEQVHVFDIDNGERFVTYTIKGKPGKGEIVLNGAAARKVAVGDKVIICSFTEMTDEEARAHVPSVVLVDEHNRIAQVSR